jgi:organic hydroperoxide reductase OsmC/OhrA
MAEHLYKATVSWRRGDGEFAKGRYSRGHTWRFDGGIEVPASASPQVVPKPYVVEAAVDPEEAFIASLSSCHMLTFLDLARRAGFVIESYEDEAEGVMAKNAAGKYWISRVTLRPRIAWGGDKQPSQDDLARLHHVAHEECFIANSVKTDVNVEGF